MDVLQRRDFDIIARSPMTRRGGRSRWHLLLALPVTPPTVTGQRTSQGVKLGDACPLWRHQILCLSGSGDAGSTSHRVHLGQQGA